MLEGESFWAGDQDALNAILMSEIPEDAIALRPRTEQPDWLSEVDLADARTLTCRYRGGETSILHFSLGPKPWESSGWRRTTRNAYVELFPRVVLAEDVALRLEPQELPPWLRTTRVRAPARLGIDALWRGRDSAERIARASAQRLPTPLREPMLRLRRSAAEGSPRDPGLGLHDVERRLSAGTLALIDSLRATGFDGEVTVLDTGLDGHERTVLERRGPVARFRATPHSCRAAQAPAP